MNSIRFAAALITAAFALPAFAQDHSGHDSHGAPAEKATTSAMPLTAGEVRRVDKATNKITIRHAPIENLGMPAMTMVFQVSDAALLNSVKTGDKVQFAADKKADGSYIVTRIVPDR